MAIGPPIGVADQTEALFFGVLCHTAVVILQIISSSSLLPLHIYSQERYQSIINGLSLHLHVFIFIFIFTSSSGFLLIVTSMTDPLLVDCSLLPQLSVS
ncbi:uncharacterized protein LOC110899617 isoform X2 [Helianthus annuus]|uniref:uncharacterized protein LOC110899617 isoform X2 n=1 Tax=Helianthus annuus TaxID=4232 RepID=UPI000B8F471F|nr:uncharacterized protein LOC110899617 isoform X2 [Helianthus annuus]